jgi:hypothetical protein
MVAKRPAHVAIAPLLCTNGVEDELKWDIVEGKGGKREKVAGWPPFFGRLAMLGLHSIPTFILHFMLLLSCSLH